MLEFPKFPKFNLQRFSFFFKFSIQISSRSECRVLLSVRLFNFEFIYLSLGRMWVIRKHRPRTRITDLDEDTLAEIITRLPTLKHMVSCKLVSKFWCKSISSICIPRITSSSHIYGFLFNTNIGLETGKRRGQWSFACLNQIKNPNTSLVESCLGSNLPFSPSPENFIDCCNGVLLFFHWISSNYYICNPSTQQHICISTCPSNRVDRAGFSALIFDVHYKIVYTSPLGSMNILSLGDCSWVVHKIVLDPSVARSGWSPRSVSLHGSLYRLSLSGHLLKFDTREIGYCAIQLPNVVVRADPIGCLGVSQSSVCYAWTDDCNSLVMVWKFVEDAERHEDKWSLKHIICPKFFDGNPMCNHLHVYAFHPTSDMLFVGNFTSIFSCDPHRKKLESICKLTKDTRIQHGQYLTFPFSINLTPLDPEAPGRRLKVVEADLEKLKRDLIILNLQFFPEKRAVLDPKGLLDLGSGTGEGSSSGDF